MEEAGLPLSNLTLIRTPVIEEIHEPLVTIMKRRDAPTAIIVITPGQAITTLHALSTAGFRVPADVSVVSVIDNDRFRALPPVLTVTDAVGPAFVELAVKRLIEKINNPDSPPQQTLVAGNVIERESVAVPRRRAA
jgi:LacI family transcriptional regulator